MMHGLGFEYLLDGSWSEGDYYHDKKDGKIIYHHSNGDM